MAQEPTKDVKRAIRRLVIALIGLVLMVGGIALAVWSDLTEVRVFAAAVVGYIGGVFTDFKDARSD